MLFHFFLFFLFSVCASSLLQQSVKRVSGQPIDLRDENNSRHFSIDDIACVLADMDGTLLQPDHSITPRTAEAIRRIKSSGIPFFPATGRTRNSMVLAGGQTLVNALGGDVAKIPGVFAQGLVVYGPQGELISEEFLDPKTIELVEKFCDENQLAVIAYAGERILTYKKSKYTDLIVEYAEPSPEVMSCRLAQVPIQENIRINKLILLDEEERLQQYRPALTQLIANHASLTRAVPRMLEVLPYGASKGKGVATLLAYCQLSPKNCIAFGDGENDKEMLEYVEYGIAVENAREELKKVAYGITKKNTEDGVAHIIERLFPAIRKPLLSKTAEVENEI
jgi:Cof subfamily protein (haloacid dehalogenase superfamily)